MTPSLRKWVGAPGSLSARLAALGKFEVQTLHQGPARLRPGEARDLGGHGGRHWVREVVLRVDGVALVWARSVTPCRGLRGPWRAVRGLGTRPLAQLLFTDPHVRRSPLHVQRRLRGSPWHHSADAAWREATGCAWPSAVVWSRSSVFERRGGKLRLFEAFVPQISAMSPRQQRASA